MDIVLSVISIIINLSILYRAYREYKDDMD